MCKFRDLRADEIECRVGQQFNTGLSLLLYKDARCDMNILDEVVGIGRWQREHYECKGNLFCRVGIKIDNEWIFKSDCGAESNTEAEKGEASDSFKRACVNFGIGRELYTAPFIFVKKDDFALNDKGKCKDTFSVESVEIKDKKIVSLAIKNNSSGKIVYTFGMKKQNTPPATTSTLPFPEAERKPEPQKPMPNPANFGKEQKPMTRERAAATLYNGMTLADLYKKQRAVFMEIFNNPPTPELGEATKILLDWVNSSRSAS